MGAWLNWGVVKMGTKTMASGQRSSGSCRQSQQSGNQASVTCRESARHILGPHLARHPILQTVKLSPGEGTWLPNVTPSFKASQGTSQVLRGRRFPFCTEKLLRIFTEEERSKQDHTQPRVQFNVYMQQINTLNPARSHEAMPWHYSRGRERVYEKIKRCACVALSKGSVPRTGHKFQVVSQICHLLSMLLGQFSVQMSNHLGITSNI